MVGRSRRADERLPSEVVELVTPRRTTTPLAAVARALAASARLAPFSLEVAGTAVRHAFLLRAPAATMRHLEQQLAAAYPQAGLRPLGLAGQAPDPARVADGEQVAGCALTLRAPPYLPLRTWRDAELLAEGVWQNDPILATLGALAALPPDWRALCQVVLHPAPPGWAAAYAGLALQRPSEVVRGAAPSGGPAAASVIGMASLVLLLLAAPTVLGWYETGNWLPFGLVGGGLVGGLPAALALKARFHTGQAVDPVLVREKLAQRVYRAQVRLAVVAPATAPPGALRERLGRLVATYGQFDVPMGNGLRVRALHLRRDELAGLACLRRPRPRGLLPGGGATALLNAQELAGLWHLPLGDADVPLVERAGAGRWSPLPGRVAGGCRIGRSSGPHGDVPVALGEELLRRHLLLVAKTRRGKSSLLVRLAQHLLSSQAGMPATLVLVDPHRDLAQAVLGLVPPARRADVVYLDVAERQFPVGLNLLDVGLGWDAEQAIASALMIFRRQWDRFWGPRMEDVFRMTLHTLYAANERRCAADPTARNAQYTILEIPALLFDLAFRQRVLQEAQDAAVAEWWHVYFEGSLDRRLRMDAQNPVLSKINRLAASRTSRALLGQSRSTVVPAEWLREGRIVLVHTAPGTVGDDTAALVGGTLLNLIKQEVQAQEALPPAERRRVRVIVDEFHTLPGADYEAFLGELAKFGSNLVLATQTLARLELLDRAHERALRATLFGNLDGLFAFHCSAEDAKYLMPELGGQLEVADLVSLGDYQCYARLWADGERLPVFSLRLDPPPVGDHDLAVALAAASAQRYGRSRAMVEAERAAMVDRVRASLQAVVTAPGDEVARAVVAAAAKDGGAVGKVPRDGAGVGADERPVFDVAGR